MTPFDSEDDDIETPKKVSLNKVSSQSSVFDKIPKKPSKEDFEKRVKTIEDNNVGYKKQAVELAIQFKKMMDDKTLLQNKNVFSKEVENEFLSKIVNLSIEINNDENEQDGMGSLSCIIILLKTCLSLRDRVNDLEYQITQLSSANK